MQSRYVYEISFSANSRFIASNGVCILQRVDLENHTWANYFLAAYKVRLFAACLVM